MPRPYSFVRLDRYLQDTFGLDREHAAVLAAAGGPLVSQAPAEPRVLILRAIDAAAADRHARLGHAGDWRVEGGCDCLDEVQPILSAAGAMFVQEYLRWLQTLATDGDDAAAG